MISLKSVDKFIIKGRGDVYSFDRAGYTAGDLYEYMGKEVKIDGQVFTVMGIECFSKEHTQFGLLVK